MAPLQPRKPPLGTTVRWSILWSVPCRKGLSRSWGCEDHVAGAFSEGVRKIEGPLGGFKYEQKITKAGVCPNDCECGYHLKKRGESRRVIPALWSCGFTYLFISHSQPTEHYPILSPSSSLILGWNCHWGGRKCGHKGWTTSRSWQTLQSLRITGSVKARKITMLVPELSPEPSPSKP